MSEPFNKLMQYGQNQTPGLMDGLTPHQRYRQSKGLMPDQFDRPTPQDGPVTERAGMFPLGTYANGQTGLAWPGIIAEPVQSFNRLLQNGYQAGTGDTQGVEDAFNVAGAVGLGSMAFGRPRGSLGSGGRPTRDTTGYFDLYHGTASDPKTGQMFTSFDPSRGGAVSGSQAGELGIFGSPSPAVANEYASMAAARTGGAPAVMPLSFRPGNVAKMDLGPDAKNHEVAASLASAWEHGYDSVVLTNYTTPGGQTGQRVVVVRNPNQLRSRTAADFDPARVNENNLLAATGLPVGAVSQDGQSDGR